MRTALALVVVLMGCNGGSGSLELTLTLPTMPDLRPAGMTTVTVTATPPGESPVSTTATLVNGTFSAGNLPAGSDVQVGVVLRDVSNRIVGVGEAGQTVDIVGDAATEISMPVRRPFVYASAPSGLYSFDPTLDPRDMKFQGMVSGVTAPLFTITVGGDRLAVISNDKVQVIVTATNAVQGSINLPMGVRDASAVPGTHKVAVAHTGGIAIVDLDQSTMDNAAVGPIDRVTVGPAIDGTLYAYGLVARAVPPDLPWAACTGSSSVVAVKIDSPSTSAPKPFMAAVSDLAAAPDSPMLFATLPCSGQVARVIGDVSSEVAMLTLEEISPLPRASVLTVAGDRIWAAGQVSSTPLCTGTCGASTSVACPIAAGNRLAFVTAGANLVVQSIPIVSSRDNVIELQVPGPRETMIDIDDPAMQHAQVLKSLYTTPIDLVALPGGQYVGLVTKNRYYIEPLEDLALGMLLPCLDATTDDWMLIDMASASVTSRVRTSCDLDFDPAAYFDSWACEAPPDGERSAFPLDYQPTSVGALFGAR